MSHQPQSKYAEQALRRRDAPVISKVFDDHYGTAAPQPPADRYPAAPQYTPKPYRERYGEAMALEEERPYRLHESEKSPPAAPLPSVLEGPRRRY